MNIKTVVFDLVKAQSSASTGKAQSSAPTFKAAPTVKVSALFEENKTIEPKEKTIRKTMEEWKFDSKYLERENQLECLIVGDGDNIRTELRRQVCAKISGYKSQDMKKGIYDDAKFVRFDDVVALMADRKMSCFYCKKQALLFYEYSRDCNQWTLERIDNTRGHNVDNVEIACLNCNLRRRTMYHERYVFTKQMGTVRLLE
jgi:hypothetical protein